MLSRTQPLLRRSAAACISGSRAFSSLGLKDEPYALADAIRASGPCGYVVFDYDQEKAIASHPPLQPLADYLNNDCADYIKHEGMFFEVGEQSGAILGAFIWNTRRGQAAGGIRLRPYDSVEEYVCDGLRLATGMGRKNATTG